MSIKSDALIRALSLNTWSTDTRKASESNMQVRGRQQKTENAATRYVGVGIYELEGLIDLNPHIGSDTFLLTPDEAEKLAYRLLGAAEVVRDREANRGA